MADNEIKEIKIEDLLEKIQSLKEVNAPRRIDEILEVLQFQKDHDIRRIDFMAVTSTDEEEEKLHCKLLSRLYNVMEANNCSFAEAFGAMQTKTFVWGMAYGGALIGTAVGVPKLLNFVDRKIREHKAKKKRAKESMEA